MSVFTIGHSTRSAEELLELLQEHEVGVLVDVRRYPGSRRHPHFNQGPLARSVQDGGIEYVHEPDLGGRRSPTEDSPNTAWRSAGFRAYADHMGTADFRAAMSRLLERAERSRVAIMCAEAVPWRCHRQLISDALVVRDVEVVHILGPGRTERHELNEHARVYDGNRIVYPGDTQAELFEDGK